MSDHKLTENDATIFLTAIRDHLLKPMTQEIVSSEKKHYEEQKKIFVILLGLTIFNTIAIFVLLLKIFIE